MGVDYDALLDAAVSLCAAATGLSAAQVTKADYKVLDAGLSPVVVVGGAEAATTGIFRRPGASTEASARGPEGFGTLDTAWQISIEVFVHYSYDGTTTASLLDTGCAIIDKLDQYRKLDAQAGVFDALITRGEPVRPVFDATSDTYYLIWLLILEVIENVTANYQE